MNEDVVKRVIEGYPEGDCMTLYSAGEPAGELSVSALVAGLRGGAHTGDTLFNFVVLEAAELTDGVEDEEQALQEVYEGMERAIEDLEAVKEALARRLEEVE